MMEETYLQELKRYLAGLPSGPIAMDVQPELVRLLEHCWDLFDGSNDQAMEVYKLQRAESLHWKPPVLSFLIERHGGTVLGSTRAELQVWRLDLNQIVAECWKAGYRQKYPRQARFDFKPIARELCEVIIRGGCDERLQWSRSGAVRVLTSKILPTSSKQTYEGRQKRLHKAVQELLAPHGWQTRGSWWQPEERRKKSSSSNEA